jgi:hypothetical protein
MSTDGRRLALVIATTEYDDARLDRLAAPLADALELGRLLGSNGGFDVESLVNAEAQTVQRRLERFCKAGRQRNDTLFVYVTGHGVKDDDGNLYFALRDTDRDFLRTTALPADLVSSVLNESPAGSQILVLDCCFSGAFARALRPKGSIDADLGRTFGGGRGRIILAASGAVEQAWEDDAGSVYTQSIVEGIASGAADLDSDGVITAAEIHGFVSDRLREGKQQTPRKFEFDDAGHLVVARVGATSTAPRAAAEIPKRPAPTSMRPAKEVKTQKNSRSWILGLLVTALVTLVATLWLAGAIAFLPSPFATTTTSPSPPFAVTTAVVTTGNAAATSIETATTGVGPTTTTAGVTTTTETVSFEVAFEDTFDDNANGWSEGAFPGDSGSSFYRIGAGVYLGGFTSSLSDQVFFSLVPFTPGPGLFYVETRTTSVVSGSNCGLALQNETGGLFVVFLGAGEVAVRNFVEGTLVNQGSWPVSQSEANQTEVGLWIDGLSITVYVDDIEIATVEEPAIGSVSQIGVSLNGLNEVECSFEYLTLWVD